jgi:hypothetical protein
MSRLQSYDAEQMQRIAVTGIGPQHLSVQGLGFAEVSLSVQSDSALQALRRRPGRPDIERPRRQSMLFMTAHGAFRNRRSPTLRNM